MGGGIVLPCFESLLPESGICSTLILSAILRGGSSVLRGFHGFRTKAAHTCRSPAFGFLGCFLIDFSGLDGLRATWWRGRHGPDSASRGVVASMELMRATWDVDEVGMTRRQDDVTNSA